jgi:two-component system sensor histidine kinase QseC
MPAEVVPLIDAFNAALARVERGYQLQQEFLATAAHELKTPLTLMRGQLELDGVADRALLLKDVERMSRQVHQLLNLTECSEQHNYVFDQLDANPEVADAAVQLQRLASRRSVRIDVVRSAMPMPLQADRSALFVLLKNLLENAILHSSAGTDIRVIVGDGRILVQDQGCGIPEADLPMLFQRFWRGAHRRDEGAGLGLAICHEIALAHGWRLSARNAFGGAEFAVDTVAPAP